MMMKKTAAVLLTLFLCLTVLGAFAENAPEAMGQPPQRMGQPMNNGQAPAEGETPPEKPAEGLQPADGEKPPQLPEGMEKGGEPMDGNAPEPPDGIYIGALKETIAALGDSEQGAALLSYLTAYEQALKNGNPPTDENSTGEAAADETASAMQSAYETLLAALSSAGVSLTAE